MTSCMEFASFGAALRQLPSLAHWHNVCAPFWPRHRKTWLWGFCNLGAPKLFCITPKVSGAMNALYTMVFPAPSGSKMRTPVGKGSSTRPAAKVRWRPPRRNLAQLQVLVTLRRGDRSWGLRAARGRLRRHFGLKPRPSPPPRPRRWRKLVASPTSPPKLNSAQTPNVCWFH